MQNNDVTSIKSSKTRKVLLHVEEWCTLAAKNIFTFFPCVFRASSTPVGAQYYDRSASSWRQLQPSLLPGSAESLLWLYTRNTLPLLLLLLLLIHNNNTTTHATPQAPLRTRRGKLYRIRMRGDKRGGASSSGVVFVFHSITQKSPSSKAKILLLCIFLKKFTHVMLLQEHWLNAVELVPVSGFSYVFVIQWLADM